MLLGVGVGDGNAEKPPPTNVPPAPTPKELNEFPFGVDTAVGATCGIGVLTGCGFTDEILHS